MQGISRRGWLRGSAAAAMSAGLAGTARGDPRGALDAMPAWMALASVPGVSWASVAASGAIAAGAHGVAKAEGPAATTDTLFEAASLSKPVLAVAVHDLVRAGRIDLDRPVIEHVPFTADPATRAITPRHLLSHASGLPNWRDAPGEPLVSGFAPGARFRYSGEGFVLLGRLVEAITGQSAAQVVRERVLAPAGMNDSRYGWAAAQAPRLAWAHGGSGALLADAGPAAFESARAAGPAKPVEAWSEAESAAAAAALGRPALPMFMIPNMAAGLWTTAQDYARFLRFARRYPALNTASVRVRGDLSWGLGWGLEEGGGRFAWHWGSNSGVANLFLVDLASGAGLVVLTNGEGGRKVYERAARAHFRREFDAFAWL
jgi:CubicO group peptidase (beta-lactamase class C family)